ncbi:zf-HC2 domain-containing protein [Streptomyces chrestomyceticus]|uniref:zf-HC2 domain-containing protein n=1 Tax=Streptomyces chrestomyceticus TaxID=68185 RepID=UPI0027DBEA84|nr:zf-HC2 domain-containing protein [Streptomyces chrestomyceticus]
MAAQYAEAALTEPEAWSLEKHVEGCSRCAATVSAAVRATVPAGAVLENVRGSVLEKVRGTVLDEVQGAVLDAVGGTPLDEARGTLLSGGAEGAGPRPSSAPLPHRLVRMLWSAGPALRGSWLIALLVVCAGAAVLGYGAGFAGARPLLLALAPVLPVAGVAFSYGPHADPMYEIGAASPSGGLRLLLTRSAAVLGVSLPLLTAVSALLPGTPGLPAAPAWLLPGLALTLGALALGSYVGCRTAAGVVAAGWASAVLLPVIAAQPGGGGGAGTFPVTALAEQLARYLSGGAAQSAWAAAAVLGAGLVLVRRDRLEEL